MKIMDKIHPFAELASIVEANAVDTTNKRKRNY
jgi:hypothetical protein